MGWPRRFTAVPTSFLHQDDALAPSPKATADQIRQYVQPVPDVYDRLRSGATASDFEAMRRSVDPQERAIGETYHHLFSASGYEGRIEADYENQRLVVHRGRHRVEAARELGLEYLPVYVRAPDERTLRTVADEAEQQVESAHPGTQAIHRNLDTAQRSAQPVASRVDDSRMAGVHRATARNDRYTERSR